jgi:hypothetical protein
MPRQLRFIDTIAISGFLALVGIWNPFLQLFWLNRTNLTLPLAPHLPWLALATVALVGLALALQWSWPARWRSAGSLALLMLGVVLWAEGTVLVGRYGFFGGEQPDWQGNRHLLIGEAVLAAGLVVAAWRFRPLIARNVLWITGLLTAASVAGMVGAALSSRSLDAVDTANAFTEDRVFELSSERNVLVFIVDTFQSSLFAELLAAEPRWRDVFAGFTYFPDATSAFPKTYASIPDLLTGEAFDNSRPYQQYLRESYLGPSAPKVLKDHGFDSRFLAFTWQPYFAHREVADNLVGLDAAGRWLRQQEFIELCNLVLFRLAPSLAKPWAYHDGRFRLPEALLGDPPTEAPYQLTAADAHYSGDNDVDDLEFLDRFLTFTRADAEQPVFRIFHLRGVHAPFCLDANLRFIGNQPTSGEAIAAQSRAMLGLLEECLGRLRELGVLDRSVVLIVGDHGAGEIREATFDHASLDALGHPVDPLAPAEPFALTLVRGGTPLVMVKGLGHAGPLEISRAPVELADVPATIFGELGLTADLARPSVFDRDPAQPRRRYHRYYRFTGWGQDYIVPMAEYVVDGFSWDPASWSPTGRDLNRAAASSLDGALVVLAEGGNLDDFAHSGWTPGDHQGRQIAGESATVTIPTAGMADGLVLEVRTSPSSPQSGAGPLHIAADAGSPSAWTLNEMSPWALRTVILDADDGPRDQLTLTFTLGDEATASPVITDIRLTGGYQVARYKLGQSIEFTTAGGATRYTTRGWAGAESWGTWTLGHEADLNLQLDAVPDDGVLLEMDLRPAVFAAAPVVELTLLANGEVVAERVLRSASWQTVTAVIPAATIGTRGALALLLRVRNPRSPRSAGAGTDPRPLGVGVARIALRERPAPAVRLNVLEADDFASRTRGFHALEDWGGKPVAWTSGMASVSWSLQGSPFPAAVDLSVARSGPDVGYCVVSANGVLVGAGPVTPTPWNARLDLRAVPMADKLTLRVHAQTRVPAASAAGSGDRRTLGLAISRISLRDDLEAGALLDVPPHVVLAPLADRGVSHTGLHAPEAWPSGRIAWTSGRASFVAPWPSEQPPGHLLVEVADGGAGGRPFTITVGGVAVVSEPQFSGRCAGVFAIPPLAAADSIRVTVDAGTFRPAAGDDQRELGVVLRSLILLQ